MPRSAGSGADGERRAIHAYLTPASHDAWHDFAAEHGVSVSAMIEVLGTHFRAQLDRGTDDPVVLSEITRAARKLDAARRRRQRA